MRRNLGKRVTQATFPLTMTLNIDQLAPEVNHLEMPFQGIFPTRLGKGFLLNRPRIESSVWQRGCTRPGIP